MLIMQIICTECHMVPLNDYAGCILVSLINKNLVTLQNNCILIQFFNVQIRILTTVFLLVKAPFCFHDYRSYHVNRT